MFISLNATSLLDTLERIETQGICLHIMKSTYSKPKVNVKLNEKKLKAIQLK